MNNKKSSKLYIGGGYLSSTKARKYLFFFLILITLITIILINKSEAKYSVGHIYEDIVSSNVKNNVADFSLVSIYINGEKAQDNQVPINGYLIDLEKTKCTLNNEELSNITFEYKYGKVGVYGLNSSKTKCNIYFIDSPTKKIIDSSLGKLDASHFKKRSCLNGTQSSAHNGGNCEEETNGVYEEENSLGKTYYYRGTVNNNWVKFGTTKDNLPIWWRIIRINEDGTIRLLYIGEGTTAPSSTDQIDGQGGYWMNNNYGIENIRHSYNDLNDQNAYIGYMYGTPGSSTFKAEHGYDLIDQNKQSELNESNAKQVIDTWYKANLLDEGAALSGSTGFCGDRSVMNESSNKGFGGETTYYKTYNRIWTLQKPSFECENSQYDLYTTKEDKGNGNGALTYPIGLITLDEASYAGGVKWVNSGDSNYGYWLRTNSSYWTISPDGCHYSTCRIFFISMDGFLGSAKIGSETLNAIRPVVNVLPQYFKTENHDGTINNPYFVET